MNLPKHPFLAAGLWLLDNIRAYPSKPYTTFTGKAGGVCHFRSMADAVLLAEPLAAGARMYLNVNRRGKKPLVLSFKEDKLGRMRYPRAILRRLGKTNK